MIERAELPVQRNSTLKGVGHGSRPAARRRASFGDRLRRAAGFRMGDLRALLNADAVVGALARRVERLPRNTRRIVDPRFFRFGVAAGRLALLDDRAAGLAQPRINLLQFVSLST